MGGSSIEPDAPAVELAPIDWTYCDGVDAAEIVGGSLRLVLFVTDIGNGIEPQNRASAKLVIPVSAARAAMRKLLTVVLQRRREARRLN